MDFTLSKYKEILTTLIDEKYSFYTMKEWFSANIDRGIIIRHDVDRRAKNSLKKALLENSLNINSTYYFRIKNCSFKKDIIKKVSALGHEIGYHYEELSTFNNNKEKALSEFKKNLKTFRNLSEIKTVAMHGKPTSRTDNRNLFVNQDLNEMDLLGDAYLSIDYSDKYYFSDTGRSWSNSSRANYRDYVSSLKTEPIRKSNDLIRFIKSNKPQIIFLMTHPERWNDNPVNYTMYFIRDTVMKTGKRFYRYFVN